MKKKKVEIVTKLPEVHYVEDIPDNSSVRQPVSDEEYNAILEKYYKEVQELEAKKEIERQKRARRRI